MRPKAKRGIPPKVSETDYEKKTTGAQRSASHSRKIQKHQTHKIPFKMTSIFKLESNKHVSYELKQHPDGRFSTVLFSDTLGYAGSAKGTTIHEVLSNEIKVIKEKMKSHPKEIALKWILSQVKKQRIEHSQLNLF
tara:strand:+ start:9113 stop:9520 length:408 start_codon:yes stop_codon:yes gene_type:complete